ncbi:peptidase E [Butyrivibrio sp.]|uniref:Type 1 glutamine amidotransferase-like domain-containing protein n=1 Tax=Butyrivibrio sp. TaxID=28121 RepID=UPI0025BEE46F|nr:peptidase E [Butyrivibrio sp.]MBQ9302147.1 peptidase E [Butyrivibrio sp.]
MGRIVAIGGGELDTTHRINEYIVKLAGKKNPDFLFIGTASHDAEGYISGIQKEFESLGCIVSALKLTTENYTDEEINSILEHADIIYVGGGDTSFMMDTWKKYGLDEKLKKIYYNDQAILSGLSAGAICWFSCGHSDSSIFEMNGEVGYGWVKGLLEIFPYAFCPHYNEREELLDLMIGEKESPCIALENNVAFVEQDGCISYIASDNSSKAYVLNYVDEILKKQEQKVDKL